MFCCSYLAADFTHILQDHFTGTLTTCDCPSVCNATLKDLGKWNTSFGLFFTPQLWVLAYHISPRPGTAGPMRPENHQYNFSMHEDSPYKKVKRSWDRRLISIVRILILVRRHLYIETVPWQGSYWHWSQHIMSDVTMKMFPFDDVIMIHLCYPGFGCCQSDTWLAVCMHDASVSHYTDVIMTTIASQITSLTVVYSTVYSDADQRKHHSSAPLAFVWGIHRDRWIPRTKGQLRGKCFHLMTSSWSGEGSGVQYSSKPNFLAIWVMPCCQHTDVQGISTHKPWYKIFTVWWNDCFVVQQMHCDSLVLLASLFQWSRQK